MQDIPRHHLKANDGNLWSEQSGRPDTGRRLRLVGKYRDRREGKGWCAAVELEDGDVLRTQDGETEVVADV